MAATVTGIPKVNLGWRVFKNSAAQAGGRVFIGVARLVIAGMIVRTFGNATFAEYSLLFGFLTITEWLVDFGTTEAFVREISREPGRAESLLRMLTAAKIVQVPAGIAILALLLFVLRYPAHVIQAGMVGGAGMVFFGGILIYRVLFRVNLTMEREVAAELVSVLLIIPLIPVVSNAGAGLIGLLACHLVSRAAFFALCLLFGKSQFRPTLAGVTWDDLSWSMRTSAALGAAAFLVVVYDTLEIVLLSRLGSLSDVAYYSAAQRMIGPLLLVLGSIGITLYPVAASYWPNARDRFEDTCQRGLEAVLVVAGVAISSLLSGTDFFLRLLGPEMAKASLALRLLTLLCFIKAITMTIGPVLYVVRAQKLVLQFIGVALIVKAAVIVVLAPRFGFVGVAVGALCLEICFAVFSLLIVWRLTGYRVRWTVPLKVLAVTAASAAVPLLVLPSGAATAFTAPMLYTLLILLTGAVRISEVQSLLRWKTA